MTKIAFETLWNNYPKDSDPCLDPKTGKEPSGYDNQCAMRVGYALKRSGVQMKSFRGTRCPFDAKDGGLVASAAELANWLKTKPFSGCPDAERYTGKTVFNAIADRTGIIFLANYWRRPGETGSARSGDHIDLWNGSRMTARTSWFRVHIGISWDGLWSDFERATNVLFWNIK